MTTTTDPGGLQTAAALLLGAVRTRGAGTTATVNERTVGTFRGAAAVLASQGMTRNALVQLLDDALTDTDDDPH